MAGRGTHAPWSPPEQLVTTGLYGFTRNPMYVAVVLVLLGWAVLFHSWPLLAYALAIGAGFHVRVVFGEEPWLARMHRQGLVALQSASAALAPSASAIASVTGRATLP